MLRVIGTIARTALVRVAALAVLLPTPTVAVVLSASTEGAERASVARVGSRDCAFMTQHYNLYLRLPIIHDPKIGTLNFTTKWCYDYTRAYLHASGEEPYDLLEVHK